MAAKSCLFLFAAIVVMTHTQTADAQAVAGAQRGTDPIRYTVSFPAPQTNYLEVSADVPTGRRPQIELMMAVWTPGSYLVREYSRNVEDVVASGADGKPVAVAKTEKNRWRVSTGGAPAVTVKYRVYSHEMSVRTNWVEAGFALVNGAPTFMTLADAPQRPYEVTIQPATGWRRSMTALPAMTGGDHRYQAPDFDTLVDSPILVGNPAVYEFTVDGKPHFLVNEGEAGIFDGARAAKDLETLITEQRRMWGSLPYEKYVILNVLTSVNGQYAGGGLEHKDSTVLMATPWVTRTRAAYLAWLELASHEIFHVWNVKRMRPMELGPFEYENEVHTRSLWIAEGMTEYYGLLLTHRAGFSTRDEFLSSLSALVEEVQTLPGRKVQSAELASFDAWIKYYRPDENSSNVTMSYYTKGAVLGLLLDARVRKATNNGKTLDDVMRVAYAKFSGSKGFTPEDFRRVAEEVSGADLRSFWANYVEGTAELDFADATEVFGVRFKPAASATRPWVGITTRNDGGRLVVSTVRRESPAVAAGLNVDDEILAVGEFRVRADRWDNRLDQYKAGDKVSLLIARREQLMRLDLTLGTEPPRPWRLEVNPAASDTQKTHLTSWLQSSRN
jgi:predicted metalloprotease with PDZ domain